MSSQVRMISMKRTQHYLHFFYILFGTLFFFLAFPNRILAASPEMSLYPSSGYALLGEDFTVDIMLDTRGEQTTKAKAVLRFNPDEIKVVKAEHADLYCQYPEDEYTVDNDEGWIVLTGFCLDPYYSTASQAELFGRFTFQPLKEGETEIEFVSNNSEDDKTLVMDTGSPPQTLDVVKSGGTYEIVSDVDPGDGNGDTPSGKLPGVGILDTKLTWVGMGLIGLGGGLFVLSTVGLKIFKNVAGKNKRTVIAN